MSPKGLVLVTGANGFIACRTIEAYLNAGYAVRGTVRAAESAVPLQKALSDFVEKGLLEIAVVPSITRTGAFQEAVKGVTAIAHLAGPASFSHDDAEGLLKGSCEGVSSILNSASQEPGIKSFVLMSSIGAVKPYNEVGRFTEENWSDSMDVLHDMMQDKIKPPGRLIYLASKVAGEKELWQWVEKHKPSFSVTALNPVFVAGPPLVLPENPRYEDIPGTVRFIWEVLSGQEYPPIAGSMGYGAYVDVRDVARLAVFAVDHPETADRQRYIVGQAFGCPQAVADILRKAYPDRCDVIKEGLPGQGYMPDYKTPEGFAEVVADKAVKATGQDWIPYDKMVLDTAKAFEKLLPAEE